VPSPFFAALIVLAGVVLILLGVLSRLLGLGLLRRVTASPSREVVPSFLPATPWLFVQSDRAVLRVIVYGTYTVVLLGMALFIAGLISGDVGAQ
jgi:hypothetical protein